MTAKALKVDTGLPPATDLAALADGARRAESEGYAGVLSAEVGHDPFLPLLVAAEHTERLDLITGIAVAFGRSPLTMAQMAWDLQALSGGRFVLGLGSQIKAHVTRRYSMPWSSPAARMRELILAIRAIWASWETGEPLRFEGEFYTHTLMTPFFSPGPNPHGDARIFLAAVGPKMTEVAGEVADGILCHGFTTRPYFDQVTMPALRRGLEKAGRSIDSFEVVLPPFVVTGTDDDGWEAARRGVKGQIAFYGSTPAYRPVLEQHGWGDLQDELNRLSKAGQWQEMGDLIGDDLLDEFALVVEPDGVAAAIADRWGDVVDRVSFYAPYRADPGVWRKVTAELSS